MNSLGFNGDTHSEVVLPSISGSSVYLVGEGEDYKIASGNFIIEKKVGERFKLGIIIKVGDFLKWPLTKDEPVIKLDATHYLFSLPLRGGSPLSYGVTFPKESLSNLGSLDKFLKDNSTFSSSSQSDPKRVVKWEEVAPGVDEYHNALARLIDEGTDMVANKLVKLCNYYSNKILTYEIEKTGDSYRREATRMNALVANLERVRKLSETLDKITKAILDGIDNVWGLVIQPVAQSRPGQAILGTPPGEIILATLDAINKVTDAAEFAIKQALSASAAAVSNEVGQRYGGNAGKATDDLLATGGHGASAVNNMLKIFKKFNPAKHAKSGKRKAKRKKRELEVQKRNVI